MLIRVITLSYLVFLAAGQAQAFSLAICNTGTEKFYLATAEKALRSSAPPEVAGWSSLNRGECWRRSASAAYRVDIHISYLDMTGKSGTIDISQGSPEVIHPAARASRHTYCIDPLNRFDRSENPDSAKPCPKGWVRAKFPITVEGSPANARVNVAVSQAAQHKPENIFFPVPKAPKEAPKIKAAPSAEANALLVNELRELAAASGRLGAPQTTKDGKQKFRHFYVQLGAMSVSTTYFSDFDSGQLVRCHLSHKYVDKGSYIFADPGCNGQATKALVENGEVVSQVKATAEEYNHALSALKPAYLATRDLNKGIANARLTILPDFQNMDATLKIMQSMVDTFEGFPDFKDEAGFWVSEDSVSVENRYVFPVSVNDHTFFFRATKEQNSRYRDCMYFRQNSRKEKRAWLDRECNGSFEAYSERGDDYFTQPKDDGSFVALMMRDLMQQTYTFMQAYETLLTLPR